MSHYGSPAGVREDGYAQIVALAGSGWGFTQMQPINYVANSMANPSGSPYYNPGTEVYAGPRYFVLPQGQNVSFSIGYSDY